MTGTEKQIAYATDILTGANLALDCVIALAHSQIPSVSNGVVSTTINSIGKTVEDVESAVAAVRTQLEQMKALPAANIINIKYMLGQQGINKAVWAQLNK